MEERGTIHTKSIYEEILKQATAYPPISRFVDVDGVVKGLYRIDGNRVRTLPIADVERKQREIMGMPELSDDE